MMECYLIYAFGDESAASVIRTLLPEVSFIEKHRIPGNPQMWSQVCDAIERSLAVVVVWSETTLSSAECHLELAHAFASYKFVYPIEVGEARNFQLNEQAALEILDPSQRYYLGQRSIVEVARSNLLRLVEFIKDRNLNDVPAQAQDFSKVFQANLGALRDHTRWHLKARIWERARKRPKSLLLPREFREAKEWLEDSSASIISASPLQKEFILASSFLRQVIQELRSPMLGLVTLLMLSLVGGILFLILDDLPKSRAFLTLNELTATAWSRQFIAANETRAAATIQQVSTNAAATRQQISTTQAVIMTETVQADPSLVGSDATLLAVFAIQTRVVMDATQTTIALTFTATPTFDPRVIPITATYLASLLQGATETSTPSLIPLAFATLLPMDTVTITSTPTRTPTPTWTPTATASATPSTQDFLDSARLMTEQANYQAAYNYYTMAINLNATPLFDVYVRRARVAEALGRYELAIEDCNRAIDVNDDFASAYAVRGRIYAKQTRFSRAISDLTRAIDLAPSGSEPYLDLANLYYDQENYASALEYYEGYIAIMGTDALPFVLRRVERLRATIE